MEGGTTGNASRPARTGASDAPDAIDSNVGNTHPAPMPRQLAPQRSATTPISSSVAPSQSAIPQIPTLRKQLSGTLSASGGSSPRSSRNVSPARPSSLAAPLSTQPSAAAIQRALSANSVPTLTPSGSVAISPLDPTERVPRRAAAGDALSKPSGSPRVKSPPPPPSQPAAAVSSAQGPVGSRRTSAAAQTQGETNTSAAPVAAATGGGSEGLAGSSSGPAPSIQLQAAEPTSVASAQIRSAGDEEAQRPLQPPVKAPVRGPSGKSTLETVQENSTDDVKEPSPATLKAAADLKPLTKVTADEPLPKMAKRDLDGHHTESGSESAGKSERRPERRPSQSSLGQAPLPPRPKSTAKLASAKSRQPDGKQGMTVETETVASIPQSAINTGDRSGTRTDAGGSVRLKPSNETIRPRKERKKAPQKARNVNQSGATSKADIFEARVASAVDEVNSSDSDETFVYESNPPEAQRRTRHHSRTPSVTSAHSVADQARGGMRNFADTLDDRRVAGKRSMKFSNNLYNDLDSPDSKDGSVRSHQPRHFGRFGRGGSHASMFDPDSPFTQASKLRSAHWSSQRRSRPNSPRNSATTSPLLQQHSPHPAPLFAKRKEPPYDLDVEAADDERTPLMGTVRTPRTPSRQMRRNNTGSSAELDEYYGVRRRSRCGRFSGCLLAACLVVVVLCSAVGFLVMSNRPLLDVSVLSIQNVLASEQELMLDLSVSAVNPNALGIAVADIDLDVFAHSKYVRTDPTGHTLESTTVDDTISGDAGLTIDLSNHWHAPAPPSTHNPIDGGVDKGTDPPDDDLPEHDAQTMLLGRIFHFDQGLNFDASPLHRHAHTSVGSLRLSRPGNHTVPDGSARWERVLLHPFDLIVRGFLRYALPISQHPLNAAVGARISVIPDEDLDDSGVAGLRFEVAPLDAEAERWIRELDEQRRGGGAVELQW